MSIFYTKFTELVAQQQGTVMEPPYEVPQGQHGFATFVNGEFLGAAYFGDQAAHCRMLDGLSALKFPGGTYRMTSARIGDD